MIQKEPGAEAGAVFAKDDFELELRRRGEAGGVAVERELAEGRAANI